MDELKPCPFCGGHVDVTSHVTGTTWIRCSRCRAQIVGHTPDEVKAAWNARAERTCTIERLPVDLPNDDESDGLTFSFEVCSACGWPDMYTTGKNFEPQRVRFCPRCGAKVVDG